MPRKNIMHNPAFRVAILDEQQKTAEIAVKFGMSYTRTRELRRKHGRPVGYRLPSGLISSGDWQKYSDWVADIRALSVKEVKTKRGWSESTITNMRRQLGAGADFVIRTKEFKQAVKTRLAKEVALIYGVSTSAISNARRRLKFTKPQRKLWTNRKAVADLDKLTNKEFGLKWGVSRHYASHIRYRVHNPPKHTPKSARLP